MQISNPFCPESDCLPALNWRITAANSADLSLTKANVAAAVPATQRQRPRASAALTTYVDQILRLSAGYSTDLQITKANVAINVLATLLYNHKPRLRLHPVDIKHYVQQQRTAQICTSQR
jgi:hypothetical protein